MPHNPPPLPDFTRWPSFPFEGDMRVKRLAEPVEVEPPRSGEDAGDCVACNTPDDAYIWVSERWRVRGMDRPTGLPAVLILECRSHFDIGDLPNLLAAELGVMTVRLERAIRSLDGVARVHVNRWGDGSAHLHMWFLARPYGRLQLRGTFLSLWDDLLPVIPEEQWLENLALVAEWLAGFGGRAIAEPAHIHWESPSTFGNEPTNAPDTTPVDTEGSPDPTDSESDRSTSSTNSRNDDDAAATAETRNLSAYATAARIDPAAEASARVIPQDPPAAAANATTASPAAPASQHQGASSETTAKAAAASAGDATGTATDSTTATHSTPPTHDAQPSAASEAEPGVAQAIPAQDDSRIRDTDHQVGTASDKTTATNAAQSR